MPPGFVRRNFIGHYEWNGRESTNQHLEYKRSCLWHGMIAERMKLSRKHRKCNFFPTKLSFSQPRLKFLTFQGLEKSTLEFPNFSRIPDPVATLQVKLDSMYEHVDVSLTLVVQLLLSCRCINELGSPMVLSCECIRDIGSPMVVMWMYQWTL